MTKDEYFARALGALSLCVYNLNFNCVMEMCVSKLNSRRMQYVHIKVLCLITASVCKVFSSANS